MATLFIPFAGLIKAITALWDTIQFVRAKLAKIQEVMTNILNAVGPAAQGNAGPASKSILNALVGANGNPVFKEQSNDPNIFNIWVADDSEFGNYNLGYQVYQTMDFGMYTYDICAGTVSADEAQIKVKRQTGDKQSHNLSVGDYILVRGSDSVPSIDGIHRVTRVDNDTSIFYIDEFIETNCKAGKQ